MFPHTSRLLDSDRGFGSSLLVSGLSVVALAWTLWFVWGSVPLYETSLAARLETHDALRNIDAPVSGKIARNELVLSRAFRQGDIVVALDADLERAQLEEEQARMAALAPEIDSLRREMEARSLATQQERVALRAAIRESEARKAEADYSTWLAAHEAKTASSLHQVGALASLELMRSDTEAKRSVAVQDAILRGTERLQGDLLARQSLGRVALEELEHQRVVLEGRQRVSEAAASRMRVEIERRTLRAPIAGKVGDAPAYAPGSYVHSGQRLGVIVPNGALRVIASFSPTALGRLRAGSVARMRLSGFSWTQYGFLETKVTSIASEVREGAVRVELEVTPSRAHSLPLQHGLQGSVEVLVERTSPARLVFRYVGRALLRRTGVGAEP